MCNIAWPSDKQSWRLVISVTTDYSTLVSFKATGKHVLLHEYCEENLFEWNLLYLHPSSKTSTVQIDWEFQFEKFDLESRHQSSMIQRSSYDYATGDLLISWTRELGLVGRCWYEPVSSDTYRYHCECDTTDAALDSGDELCWLAVWTLNK